MIAAGTHARHAAAAGQVYFVARLVGATDLVADPVGGLEESFLYGPRLAR